MDELEMAYRKMGDSINVTKTTDKAEKIDEQVEGKTVVARQLLASLAQETIDCEQRQQRCISGSEKYERKTSSSRGVGKGRAEQ